MNFSKNILLFLLSLQEKFLRYKLSRTIGIKNNSKRKKHYFWGCTVDFNNLADSEKQKMEEEITLILKQYEYEPKRVLKYIQNQGTKVLFVKNSDKILNSIGENEGFIYPAKGAKALYLSLALEHTLKLKTDEMFVLSDGEINKYYFIYHFYNWYAYKHNISGMDSEACELLKKYLFTGADTKELQLAEIYKLVDAIKQDKASIDFVVKLCRNYEGAKQALNKMHNEGSAKL